MKRIINRFRSEEPEDVYWVVNAMLIAMGIIVLSLLLVFIFL